MSDLEHIRDRFKKLIDAYGSPASKLAGFFFGPFDPKTGAPSSETLGAFSPTPEKLSEILDVAEANVRRIEKLSSPNRPILTATGGGPASGKTTNLLRRIAGQYGITGFTSKDWAETGLYTVVSRLFLSENGVNAVFVSSMSKELLQLALRDHQIPDVDKAFYIRNRSASDFLAMISMNAAYKGRKNLFWDTTLGSDSVPGNLQYAKDRGYSVSLWLHAASEQLRTESYELRSQSYFQALPENFVAQEKAFSEKIGTTIPMADDVKLFWRNEGFPIEIATLNPPDRTQSIINREGFERFCTLYPQIKQLGYAEVPARADKVLQRAACNDFG